jgi:transcriptional regulator with XRE-family HTH domain
MTLQSIESEDTFWKNQIKRHHLGKRIRKLARKINYKPYRHLARKLKVSRKTIWALANGLAIPSEELVERLEILENEKKI